MVYGCWYVVVGRWWYRVCPICEVGYASSSCEGASVVAGDGVAVALGGMSCHRGG